MANKNIYVALRPRPLDASSSCIENMALRMDMEQNAVWIQANRYSFDQVFDSLDSNALVYNELVSESLKVLLEGFNFTILAYGQTGSGKSYTMGTHFVQKEEMDQNNAGIIPRILKDLFDAIKRKEEVETAVKVSFMELYNDDIIDLLTEKFHPEKCQIGSYKIKNLTERIINSADEAMIALKEGTKRRKTASTEMNVASSRSHAIFFVFVEQRNRITSEKKYSKLQLIDLAGSERSAVSCTSGDRLKEGNHINKGLFELSNVIQALYLRKQYVPYRNSKLTQLLRDSFGGNSCTIMIACISLAPSSVAESVNTIKYASIARKVVNVPVVNSSKELREIQKLEKKVQELEAKLLQAKETCSCKNQTPLSHLITNSPDLSGTELKMKDASAIAQPIQDEPEELNPLKENNLEDDMKVSIQEDNQCKLTEEVSQGNSKKYLQEIQNLDNSIQPCSSFQKIREYGDHIIAKLTQEITEPKELNQLKENNLEDDMKVSIQEDNQCKLTDNVSQGNSKKYLQEIQNLDNSIQSSSSFQNMDESWNHVIEEFSQVLTALQQYLRNRKQSEPDFKTELKNRCKDLCKTAKELQQLKATIHKSAVEFSKLKTGLDTLVEYAEKNMKQALYARKKITEVKKENEIAHDSAEINNSEYLEDWILKEIEKAICGKMVHCKMEAAQQEIFNIRNEINSHNDEVEIHSLQKKLEYEQEKISMLKGLPETEFKVEMILDMLPNKEDLKTALQSILDMLISKAAKFVLSTDTSQEVFFKQQEKENMMMEQNAKKIDDCDLEKKGLQTYIAQLKHTIELQKDEIRELKHVLAVEHEEGIKARLSAGSMVGEYLAELEDEKENSSSISSSHLEDHGQNSPALNQSPVISRKRPLDKKKQSLSLASEGAEEVPAKQIALSCSCPTNTLNRTTDSTCIRHDENEVICPL